MRIRLALFTAVVIILFPLFLNAELTPFAIVSDTHIGTEDSVYPDFIKVIGGQKIKVIIHTGDAIHNPGRTSQWKKFLEITGSDKILHLAPGNHDIEDKRSLAVYLRFFQRLYYSFSEGDTLFLILNTEIPGEKALIAGEQLEWLREELEKPFRYKFVFLHRPLFPIFSGRSIDRHKAARDELHQLFAQKNVSLVVSGHDHLYNRSSKDGIVYIIAAGGGGQSRFPAFNNTRYYFRYIVGQKTDAGYSFIVKDLEGDTGDEFSITR